MKRLQLLSFIFFLSLLACKPTSSDHFVANDYFNSKRVLFLGNSITQNGSYVSFIQYFLEQEYPEWDIDIISIGLGSETVSCLTETDHPFPRPCLEERLDRALSEIQPDLVVACYGMNDGIYHPLNDDILKAYQSGINDLRTKVKAASVDLILITPPPFDPVPIKERLVDMGAPEFGYKTPYEGYDEVLGAFGEWLKTLESDNLPVVDWHEKMNDALREIRTTESRATFAQDGIHPSMEGHLLMAKIFLQKFGIDISDSIRWNSLSNDPDFLQTHAQRHLRSTSWMNYIGYTRGETVKTISPKPLLILMGGQSNMVGSGKKEDLAVMGVNNSFPQISYLNFGLSAGLKQNETTFGPEVGISQMLATAYPHQAFILLKSAIGGSSLLDWAPEYSKEKAEITGNARFGNLYEKFFQRIDSLIDLHDPQPIALLWMQGERDARIPEAGKEYAKNLEHFISSFRKRLGEEQLPFIMGVVNPPPSRYVAVDIVQQAQRDMTNRLSEVYAIEMEGVEKWKDNLHYNSQGQLDLGKRFGERLIELIDREIKK